MRKSLLALTFAISMGVGAEEDVIRIGIIGPFSGQSSTDMGESIRGAARVFADEANQLSQLLGKRIVLVEKDDQGKPDVGLERSKELIEKEKVAVAVGFGNYGVVTQAAPLFQSAKVPLIVSAAAGGDITRQQKIPVGSPNYVFRVVGRDALQTKAIFKDILGRSKFKKVAILHDTSPYGQSGKENALEELKQHNLVAAAVESFNVGDSDMRAQLLRARATGAQAIALYGLATEDAMLVKSLVKIDWKVPVVATWTASQRSFIELGGSAAEGTRMAVTFIENELGGTSLEFSRNYRRLNNVKSIPSGVAAAQTYDALRLLYLALSLCHCSKSDDLRKALENIDQPSHSTVITRFTRPFSPIEHEAITSNMIVMGKVSQGKIVHAYKDESLAVQEARLGKR